MPSSLTGRSVGPISKGPSTRTTGARCSTVRGRPVNIFRSVLRTHRDLPSSRRAANASCAGLALFLFTGQRTGPSGHRQTQK